MANAIANQTVTETVLNFIEDEFRADDFFLKNIDE
jgi:hypothetical protein